MAFQYVGEITGGLMPKKNLQVGADCYQGQLLKYDFAVSGEVVPAAAAADNPEDVNVLAGICLGPGRYTSPGTSLYNSTYKGDVITYDTTQATVVVNDPVGAALAEVQLIGPNSLIKAPIVKDTIGTAIERKACTTGSSDGLTFVIATIDTTVNFFSTAYCYSGANRGQYRKITTGATTTQTVVIPFTYDIAVGDAFCVTNVAMGFAHIDLDSQIQGIDGSAALTNHYCVVVHELNLEEAGKEYAVFRFCPQHFSYLITA